MEVGRWKYNGFYQKVFVQSKWAILGPRMTHLHNSGLTVRIFSKFTQSKGANRYMVCSFSRKKFIWGQLIYLDHFLLSDWAWSKLNQTTATIGSLNSQDMISFLITTGVVNGQDMTRIQDMISHDFNIYVLGIIWILCDFYWWRSKYNRLIWFC